MGDLGHSGGRDEKPRANLEMRSDGAPEVVVACETFWRCLGCGSISGGPFGFKLTRCWCGGKSFAEATKGDMLAQGGPQN